MCYANARNNQSRKVTKLTTSPLLYSVISYPLSIVNSFVAAGLLFLYVNPYHWEWQPPFRASWPVTLLFLLSNLYLVVAPFVPPDAGQNVYNDLWYALHCVVGMGIIAAGGVYWLVWAVLLPKVGKYELVRETKIDELTGWEQNVFSRRKLDRAGQGRKEVGSESESVVRARVNSDTHDVKLT
jgi:hypothetical protein